MTETFDEDDYKSKTQIKKEMHALQELGSALLEVPLNVYKSFPIPEELDDAIAAARKIKSNSALKRQVQFIGKVMRNIDAEPIENAYNEWKGGRKKMAREFHKLEKLRDDLLENKPGSLESIINQHPECNIQELRQTIRLAQKERAGNKPPKNYRKLFQILKSLESEE